MKYESIRRQVLDALLEAFGLGLIHGTSGNIAVRDFDAGVIAISPSGRPYKTMMPEEIAIVTLDGKWIDGPYKPSSETPMHTAVYRAREDVGATVHLHGLFSTVMAMDGGELPPSTPPQAELAPIRVVPFELPGQRGAGKPGGGDVKGRNRRAAEKPRLLLLRPGHCVRHVRRGLHGGGRPDRLVRHSAGKIPAPVARGDRSRQGSLGRGQGGLMFTSFSQLVQKLSNTFL